MSQAIPTQHPAVVLRSHFKQVRALLVAAMVAIVCLSVAVGILANDADQASNPTSASSQAAPLPQQSQPGSARYDGGPEEGTRGIAATAQTSPRYDGGPEEGTRGPGFSTD